MNLPWHEIGDEMNNSIVLSFTICKREMEFFNITAFSRVSKCLPCIILEYTNTNITDTDNPDEGQIINRQYVNSTNNNYNQNLTHRQLYLQPVTKNKLGILWHFQVSGKVIHVPSEETYHIFLMSIHSWMHLEFIEFVKNFQESFHEH